LSTVQRVTPRVGESSNRASPQSQTDSSSRKLGELPSHLPLSFLVLKYLTLRY
jgi:hypothetical protein